MATSFLLLAGLTNRPGAFDMGDFMKISMYVTGDMMQFNLSPEGDHEKEFLSILGRYRGEVVVSQGAEISLCRGGWLGNFEKDNITAITIRKTPCL